MARQAQTPAPQRAAEPGVIAGAFLAAVKVLGWLVLGLVFSILVEWLGLTFWWPEEGIRHSRRMLEAELGYVQETVPQNLLTHDPVGFARRIADGFYHYGFEVTGIATGVQRLNAPTSPTDSTLLSLSRVIYTSVSTYLIAAITITQVYALRLAVLLLATPVFVLAGLVGVTDGLIERDRRRFGGARETGFVYHHAKRLVAPSVGAAWVLYLAWPASIHPNRIILPAAGLFGLALAVSAATFKKHI
ncbi:MAG: TIGR03747 family integrating conjugative element membrane protein [Actinomycetota bacterium]